MDWNKIITELQARKVTLEEIATECGFSSRGAVHDLKQSRSGSGSYERGVKLVALHKRVMRRKVKP